MQLGQVLAECFAVEFRFELSDLFEGFGGFLIVAIPTFLFERNARRCARCNSTRPISNG